MTAMKNNDFRYERKFVVESAEMSIHQVNAAVKLHPAFFRQTYPPRFINNIYLDTYGLGHFQANLDGIGNRLKVRIRWYGDLFSPTVRPTLEYKYKRGMVGCKDQYPMLPFAVSESFSHTSLSAVLRANHNLPPTVQADLGGLRAALLNRYFRSYYESADRCFRITIDSEMAYYHLPRLSGHHLHRQTDHEHIIVELKYNAEHDHTANRIAAHFPFRLSRNSKYALGIERVYI
jgi:hypothetical protein